MKRQCDAVRDNLAAYQAQSLREDESIGIAAHLSDCSVCRDENVAQQQMRQQILALKQQTAHLAPPRHVWANAEKAWNQQDVQLRRRVYSKNLRVQLAMACVPLLVFVLGAMVWARRSQTTDFPVAWTGSDYLHASGSNVTPECLTSDADKAAKWLSKKLACNIQPINENHAGLTLIGADVVREAEKPIGRLTYRGEKNETVALYISPGSTGFSGGTPKNYGESYAFKTYQTQHGYGMIGWSMKGIGYGFMLAQPVDRGQIYALTACHELEVDN